MIHSMLFKQKAKAALKGNWQTALLVTFFAGILGTVASVAQNVILSDVNSVMDSLSYALESMAATATLTARQSNEISELYARLFTTLRSVPNGNWALLFGLHLLSLLFTPGLMLSCNHYFIRLNVGEDIGLKEGLLARIRYWGKALWLYTLMVVKTFLWSLLFFVPGVIAALRYSMAPYYLAEYPDLSAREAIRHSKLTMADKKMSYFLLQLSFIGWSLALTAVQLLLGGLLGAIGTLVVAQFLSLALTVYMNASCAAFYRGASHPDGVDEMIVMMRDHMRKAGVSESEMDEMGLKPGGEPTDEQENAGGGEEQ